MEKMGWICKIYRQFWESQITNLPEDRIRTWFYQTLKKSGIIRTENLQRNRKKKKKKFLCLWENNQEQKHKL